MVLLRRSPKGDQIVTLDPEIMIRVHHLGDGVMNQ
jgi:hypothetical protein